MTTTPGSSASARCSKTAGRRSAAAREELTRHASEVQSRLDFYVARLELESIALGEAFSRLVTATRREAGAQMSQAWTSPRITDDGNVPLGAAYDRPLANEERQRCLSVMRTHVGSMVDNSSPRQARRPRDP